MKKELWLRLKYYHFNDLVPQQLYDRVTEVFGGNDASTKAFAGKIAKKLGWKTGFALHAIDEYKKFVYLGIVSDFAVTPPKVIDQVWHEHLLFTRGYRDFCRVVLKRDFDHNPELLPDAAQTKAFVEQYDATLALYQSEFNVRPPDAIWGTPKFKAVDANKAAKKSGKTEATGTSSGDDAPLHAYFDSSSAQGSSSEFAEFGGGGGFSGGGGGSDWGDSGSSSGSSDSGSSDSGSDGGGSSCSSGCGGGGE